MDNSHSSKALKSGVWYMISSIAVKAVMIITTPIFTRLMTQADYGIASNFTAWASLLNIVCSLNLMYSIGRAKLDFPGKLEEYVGSMQTLSLFFTLTVSLAALIFIRPVSAFLEMDQALTVLLILYLLFYPAVTFAQSRFRYQYRYQGNIAISAIITLGTAAASLVLLLLFREQKYLAKVLGTVLPIAVLSLYFWYAGLKRHKLGIRLEYWKYGLIISVPMVLHAISLNVLSQSDRILVMKICGAQYNGIYHLAYQYAILINIVLHAVNEAWLPWFHDTLYAEKQQDVRTAVKPLITFGCMVGIGCVAIAPEALAILGTKEYAVGRYCVPPIVCGIVCMYIFQQYEHIELHLKKTWFISAGTICAAAANIGLNLTFIPVYGFTAAAYTTMVCYFMLMVAHYVTTRYVLKYPLFDDLFMFGAVIVVTMISFGFMALYSTIVIRYALLIVIGIAYLATNRKWVKKVIGNKLGKR